MSVLFATLEMLRGVVRAAQRSKIAADQIRQYQIDRTERQTVQQEQEQEQDVDDEDDDDDDQEISLREWGPVFCAWRTYKGGTPATLFCCSWR